MLYFVALLYICHRHKIWAKQKTMRFRCSGSNWGFWQWCLQMCRQIMAFPLCMCSGFFHRKSRADDHDVKKLHHSDRVCYWRREVYKESELNPLGCHLGFWHWMVESTVKSLTLYFSYISASHVERVYPGWTGYLVYSCAWTQTFWEHFS